MRALLYILLISVMVIMPFSHASNTEIKAIVATNDAIRHAFVVQDIPAILAYHHPNVEKVFAWNDYQKGHEDMQAALTGIFSNYVLEFQGTSSDMDSLEILNDTAVMIAPFAIKGTPKKADLTPFVFEGRTMILYVRDTNSPTGWLTFREMIVPKS